MPFSNRPLNGRLILLIEGAGFTAAYVTDGILAAGGQVLGPARSVDEANTLLERLRAPPHAAVICAEIFEHVEFRHRDTIAEWLIPCLLISDRARAHASQPENMVAPFASYQVVDHICASLGLQKTSIR